MTDERDALLAFLAEQRAAVRRAAHGLTDVQAAATPSASDLSVGALVKHLVLVEDTWMRLLRGEVHELLDEPTFGMEPGDTLDGLLADYDAAARRTEETVSGLSDLGRPVDITAMSPLLPAGTSRSARWVLFHLVEETARHAGHADVIRESLDGSSALDLVSATGAPLMPEYPELTVDSVRSGTVDRSRGE
ncbi:DinB family protein [Streptoalloteichus hindustanus]|uniref:DinB family protein n=1 Tax=Streptoalloteichus hindustanus TaxID=2017 RepID=UPI001F413CCA|nr:DinB family protein [Streptoalloteichus hindustanus]